MYCEVFCNSLNNKKVEKGELLADKLEYILRNLSPSPHVICDQPGFYRKSRFLKVILCPCKTCKINTFVYKKNILFLQFNTCFSTIQYPFRTL